MENIHILPTDKPSRIFEILQFNYLFDKSNKYSEEYKKLHRYKNKNIYITSNEFKDFEWYYNTKYNHVVKSKAIPNMDMLEAGCRTIILTTDQELINDGVQAIDDEFLEWFVKNSSCEEVKIEKEDNWHIHTGSGKYWMDEPYGMKILSNLGDYIYKIIIPKENPKQETLKEAAKLVSELGEYDRSLESTRENYFIKGAKWQQERSYSEEEVITLIRTLSMDEDFNSYSSMTERTAKYFLEQFKKNNIS